MSVLEVMQSLLIDRVDPPVTDATGGTSVGDPNGGMEQHDPRPQVLTMTITGADRAGAGLLTGMLGVLMIGTTGWLLYE
jgi:mannan endo-1,6-alpha-mannosidase